MPKSRFKPVRMAKERYREQKRAVKRTKSVWSIKAEKPRIDVDLVEEHLGKPLAFENLVECELPTPEGVGFGCLAAVVC